MWASWARRWRSCKSQQVEKQGFWKCHAVPLAACQENSGLTKHQHADQVAFSSSSFDWFCTQCANETPRSGWWFQSNNACWQHHFWKLQSTNWRCHLCQRQSAEWGRIFSLTFLQGQKPGEAYPLGKRMSQSLGIGSVLGQCLPAWQNHLQFSSQHWPKHTSASWFALPSSKSETLLVPSNFLSPFLAPYMPDQRNKSFKARSIRIWQEVWRSERCLLRIVWELFLIEFSALFSSLVMDGPRVPNRNASF